MCGIAGIYPSNVAELSPAALSSLVEEMLAPMVHRGPDAGGVWVDPLGRCCLGHRRLSIIDTSDAGRQPMSNVDGSWTVSFNGEIYNFLELRSNLERFGYSFRGRTDTEVLIQAVACWGAEAFRHLDGMFALAAFNTASGELLLARDPFGEKPLYWTEIPGVGLAFSSELTALERLPGFDPMVTEEALAELLMFQYIGAPRTIYRSVNKLSPGCWLLARAGEVPTSNRYFQFRPGATGFRPRPLPELADELDEILTRSLERRMISDVPLGAFLSGGVDSSTVCALVRKKLKLPLKTFSIGFNGHADSEHEMAARFARHLGTDHHCLLLNPDTAKFLHEVGSLLDEPNGDTSCFPTFLLSGYAKEQVTVAISGDGGDEMFTGYSRYLETLQEENEFKQGGHRPAWRAGQAYYSGRLLVMAAGDLIRLFGCVPAELASHVAALRAEVDAGEQPLFCRLRQTDVNNYLPGAVLAKMDRMSMRHSLEVRTPFLNVELARFAERLPLDAMYKPGCGKLVLRELAYRYLPRKMVDSPKRGFGIPMTRWGKRELLKALGELLGGEESRLREYFGRRVTVDYLLRQRLPNRFATYQVWVLCVLESWLRHHPARLEQRTVDRSRWPSMTRIFSRW